VSERCRQGRSEHQRVPVSAQAVRRSGILYTDRLRPRRDARRAGDTLVGAFNASSQRCCERICWRPEAERMSRPRVELGGDLVEARLRDEGEVGALGQVLAEEPVGVFVRSSLPGAAWIAEGHLDVGGDREAGVLGHLQPAVPGQRAAQLLRSMRIRLLSASVTERVSLPSTATSMTKREWRSTSVAT